MMQNSDANLSELLSLVELAKKKENHPEIDLKLEEAVQKITDICNEYGIGAFIGLASSSHTRFLTIFPEWSIAQLQPDGAVRIKTGSASLEEIESSFHLLYSLRDVAGLMFQNYDGLTQKLEEVAEVEHKPFGTMGELDGWEKPDLPTNPVKVINYKKKKGKGFNKRKK